MIPPLMTNLSGRSRTGFLSNVGKRATARPLMASRLRLNLTRGPEAWPSIRTEAASCLEQSGICEPTARGVNPCGFAMCRALPGRSISPATAASVVAAYGDGTIRWHRMDDGRELLALYVLADRRTGWPGHPKAFTARRGRFRRAVLACEPWFRRRGRNRAPLREIPKLRRPDALFFVLQELETARALGIADMKAARRDVQNADQGGESARRAAACARHRRQRLRREGVRAGAEVCA